MPDMPEAVSCGNETMYLWRSSVYHWNLQECYGQDGQGSNDMTRAERRRQERQNMKQPTYNLSKDQLQGIKQEATHDAAETAFLLMLGIPVEMVKEVLGHEKVDTTLKCYASISKETVRQAHARFVG